MGGVIGMKPIYEPKTRAKEYCELAINIYDGCPHGCFYCYARKMHDRYNKTDFSAAAPREGIVEAVKKQLASGSYKDKTIMTCFMCDPYPIGRDTTPTREIIKAIKAAGAHVQILTKGAEAARDFDLLDGGDMFGITISTMRIDEVKKFEPHAAPVERREWQLYYAAQKGIKTWVSLEPVLNPDSVIEYLTGIGKYYGTFGRPLLKIGKLNHVKPPYPIDWAEFGHEAVSICERYEMQYYIKEDLRKEMEAQGNG